MAIPPTGNNALFNQPGIQSRAKRRKKKAVCTCKAAGAPGEKLAPGVTRIRGNLCNVHGRYGPCDGGSGGKKPKGRRAAKKPAKAKLTPEQRAQARDVEHQANRGKVLSGQGYSPEDQSALEALRSGAQPGKVSESLIDQGVVEQAQDGSYRLTSSGRSLMNAAGQGDAGRARDTVSSARDRVAARNQRRQAAAVRQQEAATRHAQAAANREQVRQQRLERAKKPPKAGSGGNKKKPEQQAQPKVAARRQARVRRPSAIRAPSGGGGGGNTAPKKPKAPAKAPKPQLAQPLKDAAQALSDGTDMTDEQLSALVRNGLARLDKDGNPVLTAAGLNATKKDAHLFTVYKDSAGADRWLAITTTAYQDKDREIISTNAIKEAVLLGDATKDRGPLLYWHVPGLALGDCDFQAQGGPGGRFLIEGGTFRSKAFAQLGKQLSDSGYQMSPGFIHTDDQPQNGVYDHILIYERSAVPNNRAANYFTRYATAKEGKVLPPEKIAEYREKAAGNPEALALLDTLLTTAQKEDETAQARNVVFKDDDAKQPYTGDIRAALKDAPVYVAPDGTHGIIVNGAFVALQEVTKAMAPASMEQAADTEMADAEAEQADDGMEPDGDEGMDDAAFAQMIAQAVVQAITPLLDIEKKMGAHMADLKSALGGYAQQKDDAAAAATAATQQQIDALDAKLKELTGDLPSSVMNGAANFYRASQSPLTRLTTEGEAKVKEIVQQIPAGLSEPAEIAAYQLIFGNS